MSNDLVVQLGAKLDQFQSDMNQAGEIADSAVSRIENSFSSLNPGIGLNALTAAATGAVAGIAGLLTALKSVNAELAQIGQAAQYLNTTTDVVQKLQFAGGTSGISSADSLTNLQNVGRLLNDAQRNENSLTKLLDENNIKYQDQAGKLITINQLLSIGADLVKNAGTNADKTVIAQMLGLTQQWIPVLEKGAEQFNKIADSAQEAGVIISSQTIAKAQNFDDAWKQSSDRLSKQFKAAVSDVASFLDDLIAKAQSFIDELNKANGTKIGSGQETFNAIADALAVVSKDAAGAAQDIDQVNRVIERYQNSKSGGDPEILAQLLAIQKAAQAAADALAATNKQIAAENFPSGTPLPAARPVAANAPNPNPTQIPERATGTDADAFTRAENQIIKRTADYNAQTEAVGKNTEAKVEAKAIADLQTAADRAGITLTDEQRQKILQLAQAEGVAAQAAADRNQKLQEQNALLQFAGNQTISILDGLRTGTLDAAKAVTQLTNALITAVEQAALLGTGPLAGILGTAASAGTGKTGGLLGSLFQSSGPTTVTGLGAGTGGLPFPAFASGTDFAPGGPSIVGENGPEIVNLPRGAQVIPNAIATRSGGGGAITVNLIEDSSRAGQTQKTDTSNGGFDLSLYVDAITAKNAANPGSATSAVLNQRGRLASR